MPEPLQPPLHPGTKEPVGPDDLAPLFPMGLIAQEVSAEPWIDVPGEVLDILRLWRPTPLVRAERLERALGTPARIYFKDESVSPAGSHKPNTAVPQAFYNQAEGIAAPDHRDRRRPVGHRAGVRVRAVRPRVQGLHGAGVVRAEAVPQDPDGDVGRVEVVPSPVDEPDHPGSLGLAISDAVRDAAIARRHALLARLGAQPRAAAPDRHRARGEGAARAGGRGAARRRDRQLRRRAPTSAASRCRSCPTPTCGWSRSSRRRARRSPRARSTTTSATPRA